MAEETKMISTGDLLRSGTPDRSPGGTSLRKAVMSGNLAEVALDEED